MLLWLLWGRALAQPATKARGVIVTLEYGEPIDGALSASLRELFGRVGLTLLERDDGDESTLLARVRINENNEGATVRVFGVASGRLESTHRVQTAATEALYRETLAHVVLGAVEPLTSEAVARAAAAKAESASVPPKAPRPAAHFGGALGVGPLWLGDLWGARIFGRADAYVATRLPSVFGLTLGGVLPRQTERADTHTELWLAFARLQAGVEPLIRSFLRLGVLLTVGADLISVSATTERATDSVSSPQRLVDAMLGGLVQLRFPLRRGFELSLALGCDVDLTPRSFVVHDGEEEHTLFALARARPYAGLAVAWSSL